MKQTNRNYDEFNVVGTLNKKHDCRVSGANKKIEILKEPNGKGDIGNKSKGKIDFLSKYCGYQVVFVTSFR